MAMCEYHGPSCEHPENCKRFPQRKYQGDGTLETIEVDRLEVGHVLRMPYSSGVTPAFCDAVVTAIYTVSSKDLSNRKSFETLGEALGHAARREHEFAYVKLSRPYLYADTIGICANWLVGVETYDADGKRLTETHRVVVQSTGAYAKYGEAK